MSDFAHPPIFVGSPVLDSQALPKFFGGKPTPIFADKEAALAYVRGKLSADS
jgi:hypothetical protein